MDRQNTLVDSEEVLQQFLVQEDLTLLDKPVHFPKTRNFNVFQQCLGAVGCMASLGASLLFCPVQTACPQTLFDNFSLKVDNEKIMYDTAVNDCCCHIANRQRTVPLDRVQDVEIQETCVHTCFGLKVLSLQTAGQGGGGSEGGAEVSAAFLANPQATKDAILLAARLHRSQATMAPSQVGMSRAAPGQNGSLLSRLQALDHLTERGVLSPGEAASIRVSVLAEAGGDGRLGRLREAADLYDRELLTQDEFVQLKQQLLAVA